MSIASDNMDLAARERQQVHASQLRRWAITDAVRHLDEDNDPQRAFERILHSVLGEQARAAGIHVESP